MKNKLSTQIYTPFSKVDDEQRMVWGYVSSESVDSQGDIVLKEAIKKAWNDYMEFANVREMHQPSAVGVTKEYSHDDTGTYVGVKVVDDNAWKKVKEKVYKGFSIGGRVTKRTKGTIESLILCEISLVDRPANPLAVFDAYKVDGELVEQLASNNNSMNKYIEIDGVKFVEDPANLGNPLLDEAGDKVPYVEQNAEVIEAEAKAVADKEAEELADKEKADAEAKVLADEAEAKAKADAEVTANGGAETTTPKEGEVVETTETKAVKPEVKKDAEGVISLANLLDYMGYVIGWFVSEEKDVTALLAAKNEILSAVEAEAKNSDKSNTVSDLKKFETEISKSVASIVEKAMGSLTETVNALAKEVDAIKSTKVSPRPKTAVVVEKSFDGDANGANSVDVLKKAVDEVQKEIDAHALNMAGVLYNSPERKNEMESKSTELYNKFRNAQRALNEAIGA